MSLDLLVESPLRSAILALTLGIAALACATPEHARPGEEPAGVPSARTAPGPAEGYRPRLGSGAPLDRPRGSAGSAGEPRVRGLGEARVPSFRVQGVPSLVAVIDLLQAASGIPMVVHPQAERAARDAGAVFDLDCSHPLAVTSLLNLITELAGDEVAWTARHGVVLVTTRERAAGPPRTHVFDVRDLLAGVPDFAAPRIGGLRGIDELEDAEGSVFGGETGRTAFLEPEELLDLVRESVAPGTWDEAENGIEIRGGLLIVRHSGPVQGELAGLLRALR